MVILWLLVLAESVINFAKSVILCRSLPLEYLSGNLSDTFCTLSDSLSLKKCVKLHSGFPLLTNKIKLCI